MKKVIKYIPWILMVVVSAVAILVAMNIANRVETESRAEYEHYVDSLATIRHSDSVAFHGQIEKLQLKVKTLTSEKDSIAKKLSTQTSTTKIVYRTVYKDSVREVIMENTEMVSVYEERITHVKDSLNQIIAQKDSMSVDYVEKVVHDTIVQYETKTDSLKVLTTVEKKNGPIGIYASGKVGYGTDGLSYGADAGIKYFLIGPLYGKAGVEYDGSVRGVVGIGVDIRF